MVAHPGSGAKEARELAREIRRLEREGEKPVEGVQIFTPTPDDRLDLHVSHGARSRDRREGPRPADLCREERAEADASAIILISSAGSRSTEIY